MSISKVMPLARHNPYLRSKNMRKAFVTVVVIFIIPAASFAQRTPQFIKQGNSIQNMNRSNNFEESPGDMAEVNGIHMHYEIYGTGTPLVLIGDGGWDCADFRFQIPILSRRFRVVVAESRGDGKSDHPDGALSFAQLAGDWDALLNYLGIDSAYVFGVGNGADIALLLALQFPGKVSKLALFNANLTSDADALDAQYLDSLQTQILALSDSVALGKKQYGQTLAALALIQQGPSIDVDALGKIKRPVLVMAPDKGTVRVQHTTAIFNALEDAELGIFPGSTPKMPQENPMQINQVLLRFFLFDTRDEIMPQEDASSQNQGER